MNGNIFTPDFFKVMEISELKQLRDELKRDEANHAKAHEGLSTLDQPMGPADGSGNWFEYSRRSQRLYELEQKYPDV